MVQIEKTLNYEPQINTVEVVDTPVKKVNLYVTGVADRQGDGGWCCLLEADVKGIPYHKKLAGYGKSTSDTRMTLLALIAGLRQLKFKDNSFYFITVYTSSVQISQALNHNLDKWSKNGFRTNKGELVKHADLYKQLSDFIDSHLLSIQVFRQAKTYNEQYKQVSDISAMYVMKAKNDIYEIL